MSFAVAQRTREIGTRMALGSTPGQIFHLVIGDGLRLTLIGMTIGLITGAIVTTIFPACCSRWARLIRCRLRQ